MAKRQLPSPETLRQLLMYEPQTGRLFWLPRGQHLFRDTLGRTKEHACAIWNARYASREAMTGVNNGGYRTGRLFGASTAAHRVVWAMEMGAWPCFDVDHINGDRGDNRIGNLREATRSQNLGNAKVRSDNTSGFKGVAWERRRKLWKSNITVEGRQRHLGYFDTAEEAHAAYCKAASIAFGEFSRVA